MPRASYVHGTSTTPLLGETIGENLRRTVERFPDRDALVVRASGLPRDVPRSSGSATGEVARGLLALGVEQGDRVGIWSPNRYEWVVAQYATARIGAILVNINPAYKTAELEYVLAQSGASVLLLARAFRQSDYVGDARRGARPLPGPRRRARPRRRLGHARRRAGAGVDAGATLDRARARRSSSTTRSTSSTRPARRASPRAPRCRTTTSSTTATSSARRCGSPRPTASASRCRSTTASAWSSATSRAPRTAPRWSSPARRSSRAPSSRPSRPRGAPRSTACRRCSSASSSMPRLRDVRPVDAAHRHHGRLAVPGRGDEAASSRGCTCAR